jgi:hypothetical protein
MIEPASIEWESVDLAHVALERKPVDHMTVAWPAVERVMITRNTVDHETFARGTIECAAWGPPAFVRVAVEQGTVLQRTTCRRVGRQA